MKALRSLSQLFSRAGVFSRAMGITFGGKRDLWVTLGYRDTTDVDLWLSFYERGDIASQIIDLPPDTTWRFPPELRLTLDDTVEEIEETRTFVDEVKDLDGRIGLWAKMAQVDRLTGIGRFGVLLIGARGTTGVETLADPIEKLADFKDILFLKAFHEGAVEIDKWVEDEFDPRFGLPELYRINFNIGQTGTAGGTIGTTQLVNWTRIIHVAENLVDDETYGTPRLRRVVNKLDDLNKLVGSAAEIFWLSVAGVLHANLSDEVDFDPEDAEKFETDLVEAMNGIRRVVQTRGMELSRIAKEGNVDPQPTYQAIVQLIAATARIPERVLFGSERGELASSQDQRQWHATIAARQNNHAEPVILRAFFNRLELFGLDVPSYEVFWPPLDTPTELELSEIAEHKANAIQKLAPAGAVELLVPPWEAREILGLPMIPDRAPEGAEEAFREEVPDALIPDEIDEEDGAQSITELVV